MRMLVVFALVATVAACAQRPEKIAAAEIGGGGYQMYSCQQLEAAQERHAQNLARQSAQQDRAVTGDAWGVLLLGVPVSSLSGADREKSIAVSKGHLEAIEGMLAQKNC